MQCRQLLPVVASAWGRTEVLQWAILDEDGPKLGTEMTREIMEEAVDDASRHGQVAGEFFALLRAPSRRKIPDADGSAHLVPFGLRSLTFSLASTPLYSPRFLAFLWSTDA